MTDNTSSQKKLRAYLKKQSPDLSDKDLSLLMNDVRRFVILTTKIYTEPQAQVTYQDRNIGGKIIKDRVFNTNPEELLKLTKKGQPISIETFREFTAHVTKNKHGK